jgi:hypothetical protein
LTKINLGRIIRRAKSEPFSRKKIRPPNHDH